MFTYTSNSVYGHQIDLTTELKRQQFLLEFVNLIL